MTYVTRPQGDSIIQKNVDSINLAIASLREVKYPKDEWAQTQVRAS